MSGNAPPEKESALSLSRRRMLNAILGGGTGALLIAILYPILRFVLPPEISEAQTSSVVAAQAGELQAGSGKVFRFGNRPGLLIRTPAGEYRAFSAVCPHLHCTVQYRKDLTQIWCACHNGRFNLNGQVVSGPPPHGLDKLRVDLRGDKIVVSRA